MTNFEINVLCAARPTRASRDGSGDVFEDHCWIPLLVVGITQYTTKPYNVLDTTLSSNLFCLCSGQSDAALFLARPVHKIFAEKMQRAICRFSVDVATPVGVRVCIECRLSSFTKHKTIITRLIKVAHLSLDSDNILSAWCSHGATQHFSRE
jgi:hypothetical protein